MLIVIAVSDNLVQQGFDASKLIKELAVGGGSIAIAQGKTNNFEELVENFKKTLKDHFNDI